jgi:anti-sigma factor ChrR (cupin superfamily)
LYGQFLSFVGGEEVLIVNGEFSDATGDYPKLTWMRIPPADAGQTITRTTREGCQIWVKTGHLTTPLGIPDFVSA